MLKRNKKIYLNILAGFILLVGVGMALKANASLKYAILDYTNANQAQLNWVNQHFGLKVGGNNSDNPNMLWMSYYDIYGPGSLAELLMLKDWAASNNVSAEAALLHAKLNYTTDVNPAWNQMDKFDNFEGANGVLLEPTAGNFMDKTTVAYSGASPYTTLNSNLYLGYEEAFDRATFNIRTAASGLLATWQYWNGSGWVTLNVTDGTSLLTTSGTISFTVPADWQLKSLNNSRPKYFIRMLFNGAVINPVINTIKGDSWLNGSATAARGWDPTSNTIINAGSSLEYNPTPPANASARFPYQARIAYWAANEFVANPADFQTVDGVSKRTWAAFAAFRLNQLISANGLSGIMCDDAGKNGTLAGGGLALANTDFADKTSDTWTNVNASRYQDIVNASHSINPTAKIGANAQLKSLVSNGDWNLAEYHTFTYKTGSPRAITVGDGGTSNMTYDDYLPINNPQSMFGLLIYDDTLATVAGTVAWDRSNRGPIAALSKHLVAANDNTFFAYYSRGGWTYDELDKVILNDNSIVRLATAPIPLLANVQRWANWFPAMDVDFGVPDLSGWNSGIRSFSWKLAANIGGGQDIWRRDYTKAIVLHRPAMYNTTADQYTTPSSPIELNGTFYPLKADGTTGPGISSIALRNGEGAILMKAPVGTLADFSIVNFLELTANWFKQRTTFDLNSDTNVNTKDLGMMMSKWN